MTNDESRLRLADYLSHMLEAARLAREYVENTVKADFLNDRLARFCRRNDRRFAASRASPSVMSAPGSSDVASTAKRANAFS
jgi:hypothetical protein